MASVSCRLTPCFHPYWLALVGIAFASKRQSYLQSFHGDCGTSAWWPFNCKLTKLSMKEPLRSLGWRSYHYAWGVWLFLPPLHRMWAHKMLSQLCSTFWFLILLKSFWKDTQNRVTSLVLTNKVQVWINNFHLGGPCQTSLRFLLSIVPGFWGWDMYMYI